MKPPLLGAALSGVLVLGVTVELLLTVLFVLLFKLLLLLMPLLLDGVVGENDLVPER
ncbi:hypothetical protein GCM10023228_30470 [Brevibacillus fulvus]